MIICKGSRWKIFKEGKKPIQVDVVGIWAKGGGENYRPVEYELKNLKTGVVVVIERDKMLSLIEKGKMKKEY